MDTPEKNNLTRIGVLSFSDGRKRVHDGLEPTIRSCQEAAVQAVQKAGAQAVQAEEVIWTPRLAVREAKKLLAADVAAVVFNIPVFAFPNLPAIAAAVLGKPVAVLSPGDPQLPGMGGMLAAGGALEQMGICQERIWGPYDSAQVQRHLGAFVRAAGARHRLRGQVYGHIGGRSIGMIASLSASPAHWLRTFGVDMDHADQSEILRIAQTVPDSERERMVAWLEKRVGGIQYGAGTKLTREALKWQAACAAAVKRLIAEREFDFVGIKCHYEMSEYYCTQCLSAAFLPAGGDWDGQRAPVACACEADADGALTMQVLQLISGLPALFLDLRHYDAGSGLWTLCNCGGMSVYYARRSDSLEENLAVVELVPVIAKYAGVGAHVRYVAAPGSLTFARLVHDAERLSLLAFRGRAVEARREWTERSCPAWPHLYAALDAQPEWLLGTIHANHVHAVAGDWMDALRQFARMAGIPFCSPEETGGGI